MDNGPLSDEAASALAVLHKTLDGIDAMEGGEAKTQAIRDLAEEILKVWNRAAEIRKGEMFRIRDEETLSLAKLADRVGISKARADQLIKAAARQKEAGSVGADDGTG